MRVSRTLQYGRCKVVGLASLTHGIRSNNCLSLRNHRHRCHYVSQSSGFCSVCKVTSPICKWKQDDSTRASRSWLHVQTCWHHARITRTKFAHLSSSRNVAWFEYWNTKEFKLLVKYQPSVEGHIKFPRWEEAVTGDVRAAVFSEGKSGLHSRYKPITAGAGNQSHFCTTCLIRAAAYIARVEASKKTHWKKHQTCLFFSSLYIWTQPCRCSHRVVHTASCPNSTLQNKTNTPRRPRQQQQQQKATRPTNKQNVPYSIDYIVNATHHFSSLV